jgi:hypothetical protein
MEGLEIQKKRFDVVKATKENQIIHVVRRGSSDRTPQVGDKYVRESVILPIIIHTDHDTT